MVIVDSGVWIDYLAGRPQAHTFWLDQNIGRQEIGLTNLILCEVLQGTRSDALFAETYSDLRFFRIFDAGSQALAVASATNYRLLRSRGFTVRKTIDCLIATFCLTEGYALLHNDRDFDPFEDHLGLDVIHP